MTLFESLSTVLMLVGVVTVAMAAGALKERWRPLEAAIREHHAWTEQNVQRLDRRVDDTNQTIGGLRVLSGGRGRE